LLQCNDVEYLYSQFVDIIFDVVLGLKDPEYITPLIKSLLKQRNRLRRRGQLDKADVVTQKINTLISNDRAHRLIKLNTATTKELWAAVNKVRQDAGAPKDFKFGTYVDHSKSLPADEYLP